VNWRLPLAVAILALLAWVGYEIAQAGSEIAVQRLPGSNTMKQGHVQGRRMDGKSWSLDYDTVSMSPDNSSATIAHVRDGHLRRAGKPDVLMQADGVTVNTATSDLFVTGEVKFTEPQGSGRTRTFETKGARYTGATHELQLEHTATITEGTTKIVVSSATVNFKTGEMKLGRIEGVRT
jgi:lipopolysaccharide export system protein LptC